MANIFNTISNGMASSGTNATSDMIGFMRNPQVANSLKGMASQFQSMQSLNGGMSGVMNMMAQKNPQMKMIVNMMNNGSNPEQMVKQKLKEMGIDESQFMAEVKSMM